MIDLKCDTSRLKGGLYFDHSLTKMNSWRVGGIADCLFIPEDANALCYFLSHCSGDHPIYYLGLGSNVLVRDGGIRGIVITLRSGFNWIEQHTETTVCAGAATSCGQLARYYANHSFTGLEFMAGIPGTVGGALRMNAGAFDDEIWNHVVAVEVVNRVGVRKRKMRSDFEVSYRRVRADRQICFISAEFKFSVATESRKNLRARIKELLHRRNKTQPTNLPSCGSVFRNPPGDYAARLIEQCQLKSYTIGGAMVSPKHANFIVNKQGATAEHIEQLIEHVQSEVAENTGVRLELEVLIVGERTHG